MLKMKFAVFQTDKLKNLIKRSYIVLIILFLLYSIYIGASIKLEEYSPWKISITNSPDTNEIPSEHQNASIISSDRANLSIVPSECPSEPVISLTTSEILLIKENSTETTLSTTILPVVTSESSNNIIINPEIEIRAKTGIIENAVNPRTYLELLKEPLGFTSGTKDFQDKLFEYFKTRAKLTAQSSIDYLSETVHQIEPEKIASEHQLSKFPEDVLVPFRISYSNEVWRGKQLPWLTANINGRTGNIMGEYATLYALHRIYNVSVLMHPDMVNSLSKDFPNLSIKEILSDEDKDNSSLWHTLANEGGTFTYLNFELAAAGLFGPKMFNFGGYSFEVQLFNYFKDDIRKEFTFSPEIKQQTDEYLHSIRIKSGVSNKNMTFIGFHVRRTDYANHMQVIFKSTLPGDAYFEMALNYYRQKYDHPVFIVASDDTNFVQESIIGRQNDTFISKDKSALVDMSILASCNHSIITMGTYGFWGAYLADGEVVYPIDTKQPRPYRINDRLYHELKLPKFIPIKF